MRIGDIAKVPGLCLRAVLLVGAAGAIVQQPVSAASWPQPEVPAGVRLFSIAEQMTQNGVPMRLNGFVTDRAPAQLIAQFRQSLGEPLVENRLGSQTILGRAQGRYYISVHVKPHPAGAQGTVAVSDLQAAHESREASARDRERWLDRLPASTNLVSLARATDGPKHSLHLVFTNRHDPETNARHLRELMRDQGLRPDADNHKPGGGTERAYFFTGPAKEAVATINRTADGATHTVLSLVTMLPGVTP